MREKEKALCIQSSKIISQHLDRLLMEVPRILETVSIHTNSKQQQAQF
jgi:hypothetical protein